MGAVSTLRSSCVVCFAAAAICAILLEQVTRSPTDSFRVEQAADLAKTKSMEGEVPTPSRIPVAAPRWRGAAVARPASLRALPRSPRWTPEQRSLPSQTRKCKLPSGARWATVQLPGLSSFQLAVYAGNDIVSSSVSYRHTWEQLDVRFFGKSGHACDIGGNIGFYTFALAKAGWNVTTFEAMPSNVALMEATLCANPDVAQRVDLHAVGSDLHEVKDIPPENRASVTMLPATQLSAPGLGDAPGRCRLMSDTMNVGDGIVFCNNQPDPTKNIRAHFATRTEFEVKLFDDEFPKGRFAAQPIDFVKIDVEGFECKVFRGARQLLQQKPHMIQSEVWGTMQGCSPAQYLKLFSDVGYHITADAACSFDVGTNNLPVGGQIKDYWMCQS